MNAVKSWARFRVADGCTQAAGRSAARSKTSIGEPGLLVANGFNCSPRMRCIFCFAPAGLSLLGFADRFSLNFQSVEPRMSSW